ncbi:MAG: 2'-deoxycytidine 5'-triphosphate deaminase [Myxococcota bacterium]
MTDRGGVLPSQALAALRAGGHIIGSHDEAQIQPASLDLTVGEEGYAVPGSMLPLPGERVRDLVRSVARRQLDLSRPEVLVRGEVYVVRLQERADLPRALRAYANSKSSTGRIDLQTRLLVDGSPRYDKVPPGYVGPLWLELIPKSFDIRLRAGDSLNQAIFFEERKLSRQEALGQLHEAHPLLFRRDGDPIPVERWPRHDGPGLLMSIDLDLEVVGYVAKKSPSPVDLRSRDLPPEDFFDPIPRPRNGSLFLSREAFYIFCTAERLSVPKTHAVEMLPYDTSAGEFRAHYAGFFDPGFGYGAEGEVGGTAAVLEVRPYEDDLILRHGQPVCQMAYEALQTTPERLYGLLPGSHYAHQRGPRLSKFFRDVA